MSKPEAIRRGVGLLAIALTLAACQAPFGTSRAHPVSPQSVAQQPGDVPGMVKCTVSGSVSSVLAAEKQSGSHQYTIDSTEWEQWKRQGATDAYFAVYGGTPADCATVSDRGTGAPAGGLMVGLAVQFQNSAVAKRNFRNDSTLLGLGPKNIRFIELAGGSTVFGSDTGLGPESVVGSGTVAGTNYFVAMWQTNSFDSDFIGYGVGWRDADQTVLDMNRRMA